MQFQRAASGGPITPKADQIHPEDGTDAIDTWLVTLKTRVEMIAHTEAARQTLEQRVIERTQTLNQTLEQLKESQVQLVQSEKMSALGNLVAGVTREINNPVGFLVGNIEPAQNYIRDLFELLDLYQTEYPEGNRVIQTAIAAIDLDYIRTDRPKVIGSDHLRPAEQQTIVVRICDNGIWLTPRAESHLPETPIGSALAVARSPSAAPLPLPSLRSYRAKSIQ